jgi:hypothetical protein
MVYLYSGTLKNNNMISEKTALTSVIIKFGLAIFLFICLLDMPYGYYQFVRFLALIGFGILAFLGKQKDSDIEMAVFGALALLFQPFIKIALGRDLWNVVDVVVGLGLIISVFINRKANRH